jgi:hypothetical protein
VRGSSGGINASTAGSRFRVEPLDIGEPLVDNFDDISAVLAIAEGENYR